MRMDKFLVECGLGSRKEVKELLKKRKIQVNASIVTSGQQIIDEEKDEVFYEKEKLVYKKFRYYILYKKAGYVTALEDSKERTVMELLPEWVIRKELVPVGRLDKDTEGLLLFTNDGKLNHQLLSPKSHVDKTYHVCLEKIITEEAIEQLRQGVRIGDYTTLPAQVEQLEEQKISLTIQEGKFHQVKKMLEAVDNKVSYLKRVSFGRLVLGDLKPGEVREVSLEDIIFLNMK